jgi:hypothetical protein
MKRSHQSPRSVTDRWHSLRGVLPSMLSDPACRSCTSMHADMLRTRIPPAAAVSQASAHSAIHPTPLSVFRQPKRTPWFAAPLRVSEPA